MYVFKLLMLGLDQAVAQVFGDRAGIYTSPFNYKHSLGVSLGVHTCHVGGELVKMQVWDVAVNHPSLMMPRMFFGSQGAIYLAEPRQLRALKMLRRDVQQCCGRIPELFLLLGSKRVITKLTSRLRRAQFHGYMTPSKAFDEIAAMIVRHRRGGVTPPPFRFAAIRIPKKLIKAAREQKAREYTYAPTVSQMMRECLESEGFSIVEGIVTLHAYDSIFQVNVINGTVRFEPLRCFYCMKGFRKWRNLCLVAASRGWSNVPLTQRELEVLAKLHAIAAEMLPPEPERNIRESVQQARKCTGYDPMPLQSEQEDPVSALIDDLIDYTIQIPQ